MGKLHNAHHVSHHFFHHAKHVHEPSSLQTWIHETDFQQVETACKTTRFLFNMIKTCLIYISPICNITKLSEQRNIKLVTQLLTIPIMPKGARGPA